MLAFFVLLIACTLRTSFAQSNQGAISGTIMDVTGAVVPGAVITATGVNTGTTYKSVSGATGAYRFPNMNIGTYTVSVTATGYKVASATGVVVQLATTTSLNIKLEVGAATETITVQADAPTVETQTSDIGTVVMQKQILDLPLAVGNSISAMRSPENFVFLAPGVVGPGTSNGNGGTFESKISGGQNYSTEVLLDGASTYRSENGSSFDETAPSVDALGEFKVLTSTLPAEYGRTTGGIEIFGTKAGSNTYHGSAYDIFLNEDLNANTWFNNLNLASATTPAQRALFQRPLDKKNDYGGTLGGPIRIPKLYNGKDKTFFFFSWEQFRQNLGGVSATTVPTAANRTGDFSATLNTGAVLGTNPCDGTPIYAGQIYDPATTRAGAGGVLCRTAFPGNIIPSGRFDKVGADILSFYPTPLNNNTINNYSYAYNFPVLDTSMTVRIDQNMSEKQKLYVTYNSRDNTRTSTNPIFPNVAGAGRKQDFFTHYIRIGYDYAISANLLNHFNVGYNRTNSKNTGAGAFSGVNWDQRFGLTGASGRTFPNIGVFETAITGIGDNVDGDTIDNGLRVNDGFTWVKGKHEFKFGVDYRYQQYSPINQSNSTGTVNFARAQTAATALTNGQSGNGIASLLLGVPQFGSLTEYAGQPRWLSSYTALFAQDNWKVTPTLVINYGLRWSVDQPRREAHGNTSNISLTAPNPAAGGLPGALVFAGKGTGRNGKVDERWANVWHKDFAPRVGFSWSPNAMNQKFVLRGGAGIYYAALTYADFGGDLRTGFQANPAFSNNGDGLSPAFNLDSGFPAYTRAPNLDPSQLNFQGPIYVDPTYGRPAMIENWSLQVQQELAPDLIASLAYVGQHSTHLRSNFDGVNNLNPSHFGLGSTLTSPINSTQAQNAGISAPFASFPTTQTVAQALLPFPQFFGMNTDCCLENLGQSRYDSLQGALQRRFRNGLNLMASYTWSKTLTDADSALPFFATLHGGGSPQNPFNKKGDKAVSNQDIPQAFVLSYVYELPIGKGKKFLSKGGVVDKFVGGWEISGIHRYQSGQPLSFGCASGIPGFGNCIRYDRVPGQPLASKSVRNGTFNVLTGNGGGCIAQPDGTFTDRGTGTGYFNCAAFRDPNASALIQGGAPYQFGNMPRTTGEIRSFHFLNEDFSFIKRTQITDSWLMTFQVDMLDAFNRHVFDRAITDGPYNGDFGIINTADQISGPRKVQLHLKLQF
ncbi:MAG: TonB-dependent receptor [Acidobacteriaceae bacterium]